MDCAFVPGMFSATNVGRGQFSGNKLVSSKPVARNTTVMAVDSFQKQFQSFGKVQIDYTKNRRPFEYTKKGSNAGSLGYPISPAFAGIFSISLCDKKAGVSKVIAKAQEMIAMDRLRVQKATATSSGIYNIRCTEGTVPGEAEFKRVFNRTNAFREAQKPIAMRLNKMYEDRKKAFMIADTYADQKKAASMHLVNKVSVAAYNEGRANCVKYATPTSEEEKKIMDQYMMENSHKQTPWGTYELTCMDGVAKGMAEQLRVAVGSGRFRTQMKDGLAATQMLFNAPADATNMTGASSEQQNYYYKYPAAASAKIQE